MEYNLTRRNFLEAAGLTAVSMLAPAGTLSKNHLKKHLLNKVLFITTDDLGLELIFYTNHKN